jgi:hypothetical protein
MYSTTLVSGEIYLSAFNLSHKVLFFPDEGKHQLVRMGRPIVGHAVNGEIKRRPEIVNGVPYHERPNVGNAPVSFGNDQILVSLRPMFDNDPKWPILHKFFDGAPKLVDMLLGSPNL